MGKHLPLSFLIVNSKHEVQKVHHHVCIRPTDCNRRDKIRFEIETSSSRSVLQNTVHLRISDGILSITCVHVTIEQLLSRSKPLSIVNVGIIISFFVLKVGACRFFCCLLTPDTEHLVVGRKI